MLLCRKARSSRFTCLLPAVVCFEYVHCRHEQDFGVAFVATSHLPSLIAGCRFRSCLRPHPDRGNCRRSPRSAVLSGRSTALRSNHAIRVWWRMSVTIRPWSACKAILRPVRIPRILPAACLYRRPVSGRQNATARTIQLRQSLTAGTWAKLPPALSGVSSCGFLAVARQFARLIHAGSLPSTAARVPLPSSGCLPRLRCYVILVPPARFELARPGFSVRCSTRSELQRQNVERAWRVELRDRQCGRLLDAPCPGRPAYLVQAAGLEPANSF